MKHIKLIKSGLCYVAATALFTTACVNHIVDETSPLTPGDIPIQVTAKIRCPQSRISDSEFAKDDAVGLYVLSEEQNLKQTRYIDNMRLVCTSDGLVPDKEMFYPSGDTKCDFISYYPYQESGIAAEESTIHVAAAPDQSSASKYSTSDFLVAELSGIAPSKKDVNLIYRHKFCQLNIIIKLIGNGDIQQLQKNASVTITGMSTQATYDFDNGKFASFNATQDIVPNGEWVIDEQSHHLLGKRALLIPQQTTDCQITLQVNNRTYSASFPDKVELLSNTSIEITLLYDPQTGIGSITHSIGEWQPGGKSEVSLEEEEEKSNSILISNLNFEQTGVYNIVDHSNTVIAEVCKEYLQNKDIEAQAIVLYSAGNKERGTVLQILNKSENVHGGQLLWNTSSNSFNYTSGDKAAINRIYADENGTLSFEQPESPVLISATANVLKDSRGTETRTYPIVKIGTQYWMQENLHATKYNNGGAITHITTFAKITAGYYSKDDNYYYNKAAIIKGNLAPEGWKIPTDTEWGKMKSYINNVAAVLKDGSSWQTETGIDVANNRTGFNAQPIGFYNKKKDENRSVYDFGSKYVAYWSTGNSPTTLSETSVCLKYSDNKMGSVTHNDYCGYSIRCIKE